VRFFEHVFVPDELFFQTLVLNSPHRDSVVDANLRYIDWSTTPGPKVLRTDDLEALLGSGMLFARKFDETVDAEILDLLDRHIDAERTIVAGR
jgi:Core-2/I-Branching enzyme